MSRPGRRHGGRARARPRRTHRTGRTAPHSARPARRLRYLAPRRRRGRRAVKRNARPTIPRHGAHGRATHRHADSGRDEYGVQCSLRRPQPAQAAASRTVESRPPLKATAMGVPSGSDETDAGGSAWGPAAGEPSTASASASAPSADRSMARSIRRTREGVNDPGAPNAARTASSTGSSDRCCARRAHMRTPRVNRRLQTHPAVRPILVPRAATPPRRRIYCPAWLSLNLP